MVTGFHRWIKRAGIYKVLKMAAESSATQCLLGKETEDGGFQLLNYCKGPGKKHKRFNTR